MTCAVTRGSAQVAHEHMDACPARTAAHTCFHVASHPYRAWHAISPIVEADKPRFRAVKQPAQGEEESTASWPGPLARPHCYSSVSTGHASSLSTSLCLSSFFPVSLRFLRTCHFESVSQLSPLLLPLTPPPGPALSRPWQQPSFALVRERWVARSRAQAASWVSHDLPSSQPVPWLGPHFIDGDTDAWRSNSMARATKAINETSRTQAQLCWPTGSCLPSEPKMCV